MSAPDNSVKQLAHMTKSCRGWYWRFGLASSLAIAYVLVSSGDCALAQIVPDGTMGAESSVVTPNGDINGLPSDRIDGGAIRGTNLFHSFQEFNVGEGRGAYFTNPAGIENILSRVTGGNPSEILGRLGILGNANLFLINPNGIIFGPNARLDVGGSFVGSTASSLNFADGRQFSATAPQTTPLLRVSVPLGLQFGGTAGSILNQSQAINSSGEFVGLQVPPGRTLALVGGDVSLDGGSLQAPGGRVSLGGLTGAGTVGLRVDGNNLSLSYPEQVQRADVSLTNATKVNVSASGGGSIAINAQNLNMAGQSTLQAGIASGFGSIGSVAGDIEINATEAINLTDDSRISNEVQSGSVGNGGSINITTGSLFVRNGAQPNTSTFGQGNAGSVTIHAGSTVSFDGMSSKNNSGAFSRVASSRAVGNGGNIDITTGSLFVTNGALLVTSTLGQGDAGSVSITARDTVSFDEVGSDGTTSSGAFSRVARGAVGNGGNINITTGSLSVRNGAFLNANTDGQGHAGSVNIHAGSTVTFDGVGINKRQSGAFSRIESSRAVGNGGNIDITTGSLFVRNGALLVASTLGQGNAGNVTVTAYDTVSLDGVGSNGSSSGVLSRVGPEAVGNGGSINIATGSLSLRDGAYLNLSTEGRGDAGSIDITAALLFLTNGASLSASSEGNGAAGNIEVAVDSIRLDNKSALRSDTIAGQGNIILRSENLVLRRGSNITTNATGTAEGGNITIDTGVIAALEDSDISANAQDAFGGRVIVNAQGIFGTEFRNQPTKESDITATSNRGPEFSGTVEINTPDVDLSQGLATLPTELVDVSGLIAQGCPGGGGNGGIGASEFIITGRGGLPPTPREALRSDAVQVDLGTPIQSGENRGLAAIPPTKPITESAPNQLVEAQGWVINDNGEVVLTARSSSVTPHTPRFPAANCHMNQTSS